MVQVAMFRAGVPSSAKTLWKVHKRIPRGVFPKRCQSCHPLKSPKPMVCFLGWYYYIRVGEVEPLGGRPARRPWEIEEQILNLYGPWVFLFLSCTSCPKHGCLPPCPHALVLCVTTAPIHHGLKAIQLWVKISLFSDTGKLLLAKLSTHSFDPHFGKVFFTLASGLHRLFLQKSFNNC